MTYTTMKPEQVQHFLDYLEYGQQFTVIFLTKDGEQRQYTGKLVPSENRSQYVAIDTEFGFKKFNVNNVLSIVEVVL